MRILLSAFLILVCPLHLHAQAKEKLLVIVAHPDDESAMAEVLVKYSKLNNTVQVIIATDGRDGTRVTNIPAGDSLGNIRKEESRCACRKMNIEPPIFLGIPRLDTRHGVATYFANHKRLLELLKQQIVAFDPDYIITFGPDGDTHHAEHIVIGAAVTELLLMEGWVERYPLYFFAWNHDQGKRFDLGYVNEKYLSVSIAYSQEDEDAALEIMPCYQTQFTPDEIRQDRESKLNDKTNILNFRRFAVAREKKKTFTD